MAEKFLKQISFTDKDNIKYWGYTFPGFDTSESTQKTSVLGTSKFAARADHSHKTDQLIEVTDYLFMKNAERTKLGTYPDSYSTVKEYISEQVLGGNYKGSVEFFANLPTANLSDGDIYSVLKNTTGGNPAGDYRYHDNITHPTGFATGWYLVSTNRVPLASSTYDGLLSSSDYDFIQTVKDFKGLIAQGSTVVTNLGGTTGSSEYAARADHLHDSRYLMLGGSTQTVAKQVNFSSYIQLGAWGSSDIRDASGNSFLGGDSSMQIIGRQLGTTYLRSGATDLIHRKNGTDYTILDSSNIKALTLQFNGTTQITYNGLSAQTLNITPAAIGAAASSHTHSYLPLSGGTMTVGARIGWGASGNMILGNSDNHGWLMIQNMCSQLGIDKWSIRQNGKAMFDTVLVGNTEDCGFFMRSNGSRISCGNATAHDFNVRSLLVSDVWTDETKVPSTGIWCKGNICATHFLNTANIGTFWITGRDTAVLRTTYKPANAAWYPILSMATNNYSVELGTLSNHFFLSFASDSNFNAGINSTIKFDFNPDDKTLNADGVYFTKTNTAYRWTAYQDFTAGAGNSGSDIRFKKDIIPLPNILNDLRSIDIFSYIWNKENERAFDTFGVNADKLLEHSIFKKIVHERPDEEKTKFVDYDRIGVLALKGLQEEVEIREKKIQELENRLKKLEEKLGLK